MDYWTYLARQRSTEAKARALSPILRRGGTSRSMPVLADAKRTIAALQEEVEQLRAELARLKPLS